MSIPTTTEVAVIAAMEDPLARNYEITRCYHELSAAFAKRTGLCANWCTFATWASRQAGETIRGNDLRNKLEQVLNADAQISEVLHAVLAIAKGLDVEISIENLRSTATAQWIAKAATRSSAAVARGNKKVFEEIAYEFARFAEQCLTSTSYDASLIGAFTESLRQGDPPAGQDYLKKAFIRYYQSFFEQDAQRATELRYMANIEIGFHEQTRLQPEINEALDAGAVQAEELLEALLALLSQRAGFWKRLLLSARLLTGANGLLKQQAEALATKISGRMRQVLTRHLMILTLPPDRCLQLGTDLQMRYPDALVQIKDAELTAFLARIDATPNSVAQSGAVDWGDLTERLHYIADLFRCCHEDATLFSPVIK